MGGIMYAIAGGKGGVGKTTTALNLAAAFETRGVDTAVVDADLGMTNLGELAGIDNDVSVHDVLSGEATVEAALVEGPAGADILAGEYDLDAYERADPAQLREVSEQLREEYDVVIADTGAGLSHASLVPFGLADGVVVVTTDDEAAVADATKTAEMVRKVDGTVLGTVVTRTDDEDAAEAVAEEMGEPLLETVPRAPALAGEEPMVETAPDSDPAKAYHRLRDAVRAAAPHGANVGTADADRIASPSSD
jgi:septum site-determining protein MinD